MQAKVQAEAIASYTVKAEKNLPSFIDASAGSPPVDISQATWYKASLKAYKNKQNPFY